MPITKLSTRPLFHLASAFAIGLNVFGVAYNVWSAVKGGGGASWLLAGLSSLMLMGATATLHFYRTVHLPYWTSKIAGADAERAKWDADRAVAELAQRAFERAAEGGIEVQINGGPLPAPGSKMRN